MIEGEDHISKISLLSGFRAYLHFRNEALKGYVAPTNPNKNCWPLKH